MDTKELTFKRATETLTRAQVDEGEGEAVPVDAGEATPYPHSPKVTGSFPRGKVTEAPSPKSLPFLKKNIPLKKIFSGKKKGPTMTTGLVESNPTPVIPVVHAGNIDEILKPVHIKGAFNRHRDIGFLSDSKQFFATKIWDVEAAQELAETIVAYFSRPTSGFYEEEQTDPVTGKVTVVRVPYQAPIPLLPELAMLVGLTEAEIKQLAKAFPSSIGRAVQMARDALKVKLVRGGLSGEMNGNFTTFVATNETDLRMKTEHLEKKVDLNDLLARIEQSEEPV